MRFRANIGEVYKLKVQIQKKTSQIRTPENYRAYSRYIPDPMVTYHLIRTWCFFDAQRQNDISGVSKGTRTMGRFSDVIRLALSVT